MFGTKDNALNEEFGVIDSVIGNPRRLSVRASYLHFLAHYRVSEETPALIGCGLRVTTNLPEFLFEFGLTCYRLMHLPVSGHSSLIVFVFLVAPIDSPKSSLRFSVSFDKDDLQTQNIRAKYLMPVGVCVQRSGDCLLTLILTILIRLGSPM